MSRRRKYSDDLLAKAAELREAGRSVAEIGRRLGMSASAVDWHCLRLGADSPRTVRNIGRPKFPMQVQRGGHVVRRFSEAEDAILIEMEMAGARICDIAERLGRRHNSIRGRLMTLARQEARRELAGVTQ